MRVTCVFTPSGRRPCSALRYSSTRSRADRRSVPSGKITESTFQQALLRRMPEPGRLYRAEYVQARGKHRGARVRHYLNGNVVLWLRDNGVGLAPLPTNPVTPGVLRMQYQLSSSITQRTRR